MKALAVALLAGMALAIVPAEAAAPKRVAVLDNSFSPRSVVVRKGATVTWVWRGRARHDVFVYAGPRSGRPRPCPARRSGTCSRRFRTRGRFSYVCTRHGSMTGAVRVR